MLCAAGLTQSNPLLTEYLQLGRLCPVSMELFHQVINCPTSENGEGASRLLLAQICNQGKWSTMRTTAVQESQTTPALQWLDRDVSLIELPTGWKPNQMLEIERGVCKPTAQSIFSIVVVTSTLYVCCYLNMHANWAQRPS